MIHGVVENVRFMSNQTLVKPELARIEQAARYSIDQQVKYLHLQAEADTLLEQLKLAQQRRTLVEAHNN
jgi:hypothetical protein